MSRLGAVLGASEAVFERREPEKARKPNTLKQLTKNNEFLFKNNVHFRVYDVSALTALRATKETPKTAPRPPKRPPKTALRRPMRNPREPNRRPRLLTTGKKYRV